MEIKVGNVEVYEKTKNPGFGNKLNKPALITFYVDPSMMHKDKYKLYV